jgi:hypothetical protein
MNELYFIGMDIVEEVKSMVEATMLTCTYGMTENELKAYKLGVQNVLSALDTTIYDNELTVVNINGMEMPTELSVDELEEFFSEV